MELDASLDSGSVHIHTVLEGFANPCEGSMGQPILMNGLYVCEIKGLK